MNKFVSDRDRDKESANYFQSIAINRQKECIRLESVIKSLQAKQNDQEFLDKAAIAAMQSIITVNTDKIEDINTYTYKSVLPDFNITAKQSYDYANVLLAEKNRLQGIDNENN